MDRSMHASDVRMRTCSKGDGLMTLGHETSEEVGRAP